MNIKEIFNADVYRDGGSYGFCFYSDDGNWYEFFIKRDLLSESGNDYFPPEIYLEGCNSKKVIASLSWVEGQKFIEGLTYNERFEELSEIVNNGGNFT